MGAVRGSAVQLNTRCSIADAGESKEILHTKLVYIVPISPDHTLKSMQLGCAYATLCMRLYALKCWTQSSVTHLGHCASQLCQESAFAHRREPNQPHSCITNFVHIKTCSNSRPVIIHDVSEYLILGLNITEVPINDCKGSLAMNMCRHWLHQQVDKQPDGIYTIRRLDSAQTHCRACNVIMYVCRWQMTRSCAMCHKSSLKDITAGGHTFPLASSAGSCTSARF